MITIDLIHTLQEQVKLIFVCYNIDINLEDDDEMADFVSLDLEDTLLETEDKHIIITYNYLLQMMAGNPNLKDIKIEVR